MTPVATVRLAGLEDLEGLVELRLENARVHVELEPLVYRVPDADVVQGYFTDVIRRLPDLGAVFVAQMDAQIVGSVEVVPYPEPPKHQILRPFRGAHVHTVVAPHARGGRIGTALLTAAETWAVEQGLDILVAGMALANQRALTFYGGRGYRRQGVSAVKWLDPLSGDLRARTEADATTTGT
jgi:GNAT superfamily N-acetyltransferase